MEGGEDGRLGGEQGGEAARAPSTIVVVTSGGKSRGVGEAPERLEAGGVYAVVVMGECGEGAIDRGRWGRAGEGAGWTVTTPDEVPESRVEGRWGRGGGRHFKGIKDEMGVTRGGFDEPRLVARS